MNIVDELLSRRIAGHRGLPIDNDALPQNLEDAFLVQMDIIQRWCDTTDDRIAGWKVALPAADKWIIAPILESTVYRDTVIKLKPINNMAHIEPEYVFTLQQGLTAQSEPYNDTDVQMAFGDVRMALELIGSRFIDPSQCSFIEIFADGLQNQGVYIGPALTSDYENELSLEVRSESKTALHNGVHPNGDARIALPWFVNFLSARGISLHTGQFVITGSLAGVLELPLAQEISFRYGQLGEFKCQFETR